MPFERFHGGHACNEESPARGDDKRAAGRTVHRGGLNRCHIERERLRIRLCAHRHPREGDLGGHADD
jgi:hypothetical protein